MKTVILARSNAVYSEPRVQKCASSLSRAGWKVTVLAWDRGSLPGLPKRERRNGYEILRVKFKAPFGLLTTAPFLLVWFLIQFAYYIIIRPRVIHACDLDTVIPALLAKITYRARVVYDIYDFYAHRLRMHPLIITALSMLERFLIRFPEITIIADDGRIEEIKNARPKKFLVIYNSPNDVELLLRHNTKFKDRFRMFYAGKLTFGRGIEDVIGALRELRDVEFVLAGYEGLHIRQILESVNKSPNVRYVGVLTYDEVLEAASTSDVLFALYDPTLPINRFASPNKLFEAMMLGKPIIVSADTLMGSVVQKERCGLTVTYGNIQKLRGAIRFLLENAEHARELGLNGRRAYLRKYSWSIMEKRLHREYSRLAD